jgi:cation diffusion facilitator family transporter
MPDTVANQKVRLVTWVGMFVNIGLSFIKFLLGIIGGSQALVADAVHSLSDLATDLAIIMGSHYWSAPPDHDHPYGHHRIETVITTSIGLLLALVAIGIGYNAVTQLHLGHTQSPKSITLYAALLSIISKELLYRWTFRVGQQVKSAAVRANAWHHRTDALSSIPVAVSIGVAAFRPDWSFVDHIGALGVSLFILSAAWGILWPALVELTDGGVSSEDRQKISELASDTAGVESVHAVRARRFGPGIYVDLHLMVDGRMTVRKGHDISERTKTRLLEEGPNVVDVLVHLEPQEDDDQHED